MQIVFMGTPDFAVGALEALIRHRDMRSPGSGDPAGTRQREEAGSYSFRR